MSKQRNKPVVGGAPSGMRRAAEPLNARSVIASTLLRSDLATLPGAVLVRWCEAFGIAPGTTRVALSRMQAAGELASTDGAYGLVGTLAAKQRAQDFALAPRTRVWHGDWRGAVVAPGRRSATERAALRAAFARLRMAEWREGLWLRPDNLREPWVVEPRVEHRPEPPVEREADPTGPADAVAVVEEQCTWVRLQPDADPAALAAELFGVADWAEVAVGHRCRLEPLVARLADPGDDAVLAESFTTAAFALAHIRTDPLLPPELLTPGWPGADLRDAYAAFEAAFKSRWHTWRTALSD